MSWTASAETMISEQIVARGIRSEAVLAAMRSVPRHLFLPHSLRESAWIDSPLPIGEDQTISQPYMVARMTELLMPSEGEDILEIGTGSGYQAAVLAAMGAKVTSVERIRSLADRAKELLAELGYDVTVLWSDGTDNRPLEDRSFDGIMVTAAAPDVDPSWDEMLRPGGRMVLPVSVASGGERLLLRKKGLLGAFENVWRDYCRFVPLLKGRKGEECAEGKGQTSER